MRATTVINAKYKIPIQRVNRVYKYILTPELKSKFTELYPVTPDAKIAEWFGIGHSTIQRFRDELELKKNMSVINRNRAQSIKEKLRGNGYYDSVKGKPLSEATIIRLKRSHKELEAKIRRNMKWGLPNPTKLHRPYKNFSIQQIRFRNWMKNYGYILGDFSEEKGERYVIYYDDETSRHSKSEKNAVKYGFTIKELKEDETDFKTD